MQQFVESIHGVLAARGRGDSPTCTTCHGIHGIKAKVDPESSVNERRIALTTCPQCHAAERISQEYGITRGLVRSYYDSFHGLSYRGGTPSRPTVPVAMAFMTSFPPPTLAQRFIRTTCRRRAGSAIRCFSQFRKREDSYGGIPRRKRYFREGRRVGPPHLYHSHCDRHRGMVIFNAADWVRKTVDRKH